MRALVLEPVEDLREQIVTTLCERGFSVEVSQSAERLLTLCERREIDLAVIRYSPDPGVTETLCRQIRHREDDWELCLLIALPEDAVGEAQTLLDAGASDLLDLPLEQRTLELRLSTARHRLDRDLRARKIQGELELRLKQRDAIADISRLALAGEEVPGLARETASILVKTLGADFCLVTKLLPATQELDVIGAIGLGVGNPVTRLPAGPETEAARTLAAKEPVVVDDFRKESWFALPGVVMSELPVSGMCVTIRGSKGPFGLLGVYTRKRRKFGPDDVSFFQTAAHLLASAFGLRDSESAQRASEERFRTMVESAPNGLLLVDVNGKIQMASAYVESLFGFEPNELVGESVDRLVPLRFRGHHSVSRREFVKRPANRMMGEGRDLWGLRKNGSEFPIEIGLSPLKGHSGMQVVCNVIDITQRKRLEEQFIQSQKMESMGRLAGGLAHDFNNLLTVILTNCGFLLGKANLSETAQNDVQGIKSAADRAAILTGQLLAFSRKQVLAPRVLELNQLLDGVEQMLGRLLGESIDLVIHRGVDAGTLQADPTQLEQAIVNLAVNAQDAMPDGGILTLETSQVDLDEEYCSIHADVGPGRYVQLSVSDTGFGMDETTLQNIFEPFYTTKPIGKGTGLGLSTSLGIVKQSGGHIWVYSEPGRGTVFRLYFPCLEQAGPVKERVEKLDNRYHGSATLLVVEDADHVRGSAQRILAEQGYKVLLASGGKEAIRICNEFQGEIDLLLTDVVMPEMNGRELAEFLRPIRPDMRIMFMSGYTNDAVLQQHMVDLDAAFLQKPFTVDSLARQVFQALDVRPTRSRKPSAILLIDDDDDVREGVAGLLEDVDINVHRANSLSEGLVQLSKRKCDLVLTDFRLPGEGDPVEHISREFPEMRIVVMSGDITSADGLQDGAGRVVSLLQKPFELSDLLRTIETALRD